MNVCIDGENQQVEYLYNEGRGGIIDDDTDNNLEQRRDLILKYRGENKTSIFETRTLHEVLEEKNFPFNLYTFLALTIERPTPELNNKLFNNGYIFVKNYKVDSFYIHSSISNLNEIYKEPFSQIPPKIW